MDQRQIGQKQSIRDQMASFDSSIEADQRKWAWWWDACGKAFVAALSAFAAIWIVMPLGWMWLIYALGAVMIACIVTIGALVAYRTVRDAREALGRKDSGDAF
jgi:hypothetical protein